jgi:hypothetical protein
VTMKQFENEENPVYPNESNPEHERYGFMEREVAFKLLASHAMVDPDYFEYLRKDPVAAAAHLHIALEQKDIEYLVKEVDWDRLADMAEPVRASLKLELVTNSW